MIRTLLATTALALSTAAMAQDTQVPPTEMPSDPTVSQPAAQPLPDVSEPVDSATAPAEPAPALTDPAVPMTAQTDPAAPPAEPADAATEEAQAEPQANSVDAVTQVVEADFATYAAGGDELTKEGFGRWMAALRAGQGGEGDHQAWTEAAFAQADTDSNGSVSRAELTSFLQG